jgi:hypothetical protein
MAYIDYDRLSQISAEEFRGAHPYPWINPAGVLTEAGYAALRGSLPDVGVFERRFGERRKYGQQSHDRFALEYRRDLDIPREWHDFVAELRDAPYQRWVREMLGTRSIHTSFHWHYTPRGCSVSPHCDAKRKLGSHIFYFNTEDDWDPDWGGETVVLDDEGQLSSDSAPAFEDFAASYGSKALGNYSLLFARKGNSWHGVREITCPEGHLRKVFIVVLNRDTPLARAKRVLGSRRGGY